MVPDNFGCQIPIKKNTVRIDTDINRLLFFPYLMLLNSILLKINEGPEANNGGRATSTNKNKKISPKPCFYSLASSTNHFLNHKSTTIKAQTHLPIKHTFSIVWVV